MPSSLATPEIVSTLAPFLDVDSTRDAVADHARIAELHAEAALRLSWLTSQRAVQDAERADRADLTAALVEGRPATRPVHAEKLAEETAAASRAVEALRDGLVDAYDRAVGAIAEAEPVLRAAAAAERARGAERVETLSAALLEELADLDGISAGLAVLDNVLDAGDLTVRGLRFERLDLVTVPTGAILRDGLGRAGVSVELVLRTLGETISPVDEDAVDLDEDLVETLGVFLDSEAA